MKEVTQIIIESRSGLCRFGDAYYDKLIISPDSVSYRYEPEISSSDNSVNEWSYTSGSDIYREKYDAVVCMLSCVTDKDYPVWDDLVTIYFTITYNDSTQFCKEFCTPLSYFKKLFKEINTLIPSNEKTPEFLK